MIDDEINPPRPSEKVFETHSIFRESDPESVERADPAALLIVRMLKESIKELGKIEGGEVREISSNGTVTLGGVVYETSLVFKAAKKARWFVVGPTFPGGAA